MLVTSPKDCFVEKERELPVVDHADVIVVGGGPGGIAAAVSAARNGADVVLLERFGVLGGTWTSGYLSAIMDFPFVRGLFEEITERLNRASGWRSFNDGEYGSIASYDVELAKVVLDELVMESGVRPYFFAPVCSVFVEDGRIEGVVIESKEGRQVITADIVIDSSGDGDVSALAGVPFHMGRDEDGGTQPMTMIFTMDGIDEAAAHKYAKEDPGYVQKWKAAKEAGEVTVPREDVLYFPVPRDGAWSFNTTRIINHDATKLKDVTHAMIEGRRQVAEVAAFLKAHVPGFKNAWISATAAHIGVRESRRIQCGYTMTTDDILKAAQFDDAIARGNWFIDIHNPSGEGTTRIRPPEGQWYEVPYRSICAKGIDNLLIASRCLDSTHEAHAAVRITPQVVAIGQGAGTAAALCVKHGVHSVNQVNLSDLRDTLRAQKAFL